MHSVVDEGTSGCTLTSDGALLRVASVGRCVVLAAPQPAAGFVTTSTERVIDVRSGCAAGLKCVVGEVGPGGGVVVYAAPTPQKWGTYIEAAPSDWAATISGVDPTEVSGGVGIDPRLVMCSTSTVVAAGASMGAAIGAGAVNTAQLDESGCRAARVVRQSKIGGQTDWVIPSRGDLEQICTYLKAGAVRKNCIAGSSKSSPVGFTTDTAYYWSSTFTSDGKVAVLRMASSVLDFGNFPRTSSLWLHPVRYFGPSDQEDLLVYPRLIDFGFPVSLGVLGGSGSGSVSYSVVDPGSAGCSIKDEKLVQNDVGTCVVSVTKQGSGKFVTASSRSEITVRQSRPQMWVWAKYGGGYAGRNQDPVGVGISSSPRLEAARLEVSDAGTSKCWLSDGNVHALAAGNCSVQAVFDGDVRYFAGKSVAFTLRFVDSCETGGACFINNVGPGGGRVFLYTGPNTFFTDSLSGGTRKFLEVAPSDWYTTLADTKSSGIWGCTKTLVLDADKMVLGDGSKNTATVAENCSGSNVFQAVKSYRGGGYSDWYIPSRVELNELCKFARGARNQSGWWGVQCDSTGELGDDFTSNIYWSSSQSGPGLAWAQLFDVSDRVNEPIGTRITLRKDQVAEVRPIRSFCQGWCPSFG